MNIGIDIDDTITNSSDVFVEYAKKYNKEKGIIHTVDNTTLNQEKAFGWTKDNQKEFIEKYLRLILINAKEEKQSSKVINKLGINNNIFIITARNNKETENVYELTEKWLKEHNFKYNELITEAKNKLEICKKYNIDLFIDDNYETCMNIFSNLKIPVFIYTTRYNKKTDIGNLIRVNNWNEIERKVGETKNE